MSQQQETLEQEEQLVYALKRIDVGAANHSDVVVLAAALGLTQYISTQTQPERTQS